MAILKTSLKKAKTEGEKHFTVLSVKRGIANKNS